MSPQFYKTTNNSNPRVYTATLSTSTLHCKDVPDEALPVVVQQVLLLQGSGGMLLDEGLDYVRLGSCEAVDTLAIIPNHRNFGRV